MEVQFLNKGGFVAQSIATYPITRAIRKLGALNTTQFATDPGSTPLKEHQLLSEMEYREAKETYGAEAFLAKPFDVPDLLRVLASVLPSA